MADRAGRHQERNVSETCRRHGSLRICFYLAGKMKQSRERRPRLGEKRGCAETEKDHRIRQLERALGRKSLEIEILKNVVGE